MFFFAIALVLNSCQESKDEELDIQEPTSITDELEKIETTFNKGDVKIENDFSVEKIETDSSPALREKIENELLVSYTKQKTYSRSSGVNFVGVFKDLTCAGYQELSIRMDCEDQRPKTKIVDWVGDSYADTSKNSIMRFCIVPNNFTKTNHDYAVLNLTSNVPNSTYRIDRYFDNEDRKNSNRSTIDGTYSSGWKGYTLVSGRNLQLSWIMYPRTSSPTALPSYNMAYGVLGKFGTNKYNKGYIDTDDEDRRNSNRCNVYKYSSTGNRTLLPRAAERTSVLRNVLNEGRNTRLFISKVN